MAAPLFVAFAAGTEGPWVVERVAAVKGEGLALAPRLGVHQGPEPLGAVAGAWVLRGVTGQMRYTTQAEKAALENVQAGLGRWEATCGALIPIRKSQAWWDLAQDQRRRIFEEQSRHIGMSMDYLPAIARRLHHSRDLGEPFDFLTWFEFAPEHTGAFDELLSKLRASEEWNYVEREVEVRVRKA